MPFIACEWCSDHLGENSRLMYPRDAERPLRSFRPVDHCPLGRDNAGIRNSGAVSYLLEVRQRRTGSSGAGFAGQRI